MSDEQELCEVCGETIETMCFKRTGVCSENCRKRREESNVEASGT